MKCMNNHTLALLFFVHGELNTRIHKEMVGLNFFYFMRASGYTRSEMYEQPHARFTLFCVYSSMNGYIATHFLVSLYL